MIAPRLKVDARERQAVEIPFRGARYRKRRCCARCIDSARARAAVPLVPRASRARAPPPGGPWVGGVTDVALYTARGCHLCERARRTLEEVRDALPFELREVDITGDPELERRYRELLPVVEIDGRRAFVYHVSAERLRAALSRAQSRP